MPHGNPGALFKGRVQPNQWPYLYRVLQAAQRTHERLVVVCCGAFTVPEIARKAGWKPEKIETSDISLFTTTIGTHIINGDIAALKVGASPDLRLPKQVDLETPEGILYALKFAMNVFRIRQGKLNAYDRMFHDDLRRRTDEHLDDLRKALAGYRSSLSGIKYQPRDLFDHLESVHDDPTTLVVSTAPFYDGDFDAQFDVGGLLTWDEPDVAFYGPKTDYPRLREKLLLHPGLALWYHVNPSDDDMARAAFGFYDGKGKTKVLLANRPDEVRQMAGGTLVAERRYPPSMTANVPIMPGDYEITDRSKLTVMQVSSMQASYYRDMFIHRMGNTVAERSFLYLIDGMVWAVVGINAMRFNTGMRDYMEETYAIVRTSRWWRLGRLVSQTLVCREFIDLCTDERVKRIPTGMRGTVWSPHPECKASRGAFKVVERTFDKKVGLYKLRNHGKAREVTLQQTLERWLKAERDYWKQFPHRRGVEEMEQVS